MQSIKSFSICTIITDWYQYRKLNESLLEGGFNETNSEFIYVDNSNGNRMDAYEAIRHFIKVSNNEYLILTHQDVIFPTAGCDKLNTIIEEISILDKHWAVLSNAGKYIHPLIGYTSFSDGESTWRTNNLPHIVNSVDEHFIVLKKSTGVTVGRDLDGFHFYGTELCQVAKMLGYSCYVIDFLLVHYSHGNIDDSFYQSKNKIEKKYANLNKTRRIDTMCTSLCVNKGLLNKIMSDLFSYYILLNSPHHMKSRKILKSNARYSLLISRLILKSCGVDLVFSMRKNYIRIKSDILWWRNNWRSRVSF